MVDEPVAKRVRVSGRVQGVGYRYWTSRQAEAAGLSGFVRNRGDGTVEAVFMGPGASVDEMIVKCRLGPPGATVTDVVVEVWTGDVLDGFAVLPTL